MTALLQSSLKNKHTSGAALVFAVLKVGAGIAATWYPAHDKQIRDTADLLEGVAVLYLGAAAGDAAQSTKQVDVLEDKVKTSIETGDTSTLNKP